MEGREDYGGRREGRKEGRREKPLLPFIRPFSIFEGGKASRAEWHTYFRHESLCSRHRHPLVNLICNDVPGSVNFWSTVAFYAILLLPS